MSEELLNKIAETLGVSIDDIKSTTPIVMNFHNSPYSGQYTSNYIDAQLVELLQNELQEKNNLIYKLIDKLK